MKFKSLHPNFKLPIKSTALAGAYDLFMPEDGLVIQNRSQGTLVKLGFAAEVPQGYVALLLPRSGVGAKNGLALNNTVGVIDSDYRGEWMASFRIHNALNLHYDAGDRLLQMLIVPVGSPELELVEELSDTARGEGGFGSTGD